MNVKPNTQELIQVSADLGIDTVVLEENESRQYIKKVIDVYKPFKITGHLSIGENIKTIPLNDYEYSFSTFLRSEPAYIFFDQESRDRNVVVVVKDANFIGRLMENSYGMEYFVSNEKMEFLISVNWYVIEVAGTAINALPTDN